MLEETEVSIKHGQCRDTGNIGHASHMMKTKTTQNTKKMSNLDPRW